MNRRQRRLLALIQATALVFPVMLTTPATTLGAPQVAPMPGERFLTEAERNAALNAMDPSERSEIGDWFRNDQSAGLVVAYARREFSVAEGLDGSVEIMPLGFAPSDPTSGLSIPSHLVATTATKPGTDLTITFTVTRTRTTPPYEWMLHAYASWARKTFPTGLDAYNTAEDSIGVAWSDNFYTALQTSGGLYMACPNGSRPGIDIYQSDGVPKVGIGWSWHEWSQFLCKPHTPQAMEYAHGAVYVREDTWKYGTAEAVMKYFHTWSSGSYSLGFGASGPSVSISPTSNQWSLAVGLTFSH